MNRLMLLAVLLFESTVVFCQSSATPHGSPQAPGKAAMGQVAGQWPLGFSNCQPGQTAARPWFKSFDCHGSNSTRNQASAPIDLDRLFNANCTDLKSQVELFARNEDSFSRSPLVVRPHAKGEPIPGQWPNAKIEQIPTQWPNLKLQLIDGGSAGLVPAHGGQK
jgi:hypothetical protein